jgi:hypothetical protein
MLVLDDTVAKYEKARRGQYEDIVRKLYDGFGADNRSFDPESPPSSSPLPRRRGDDNNDETKQEAREAAHAAADNGGLEEVGRGERGGSDVGSYDP